VLATALTAQFLAFPVFAGNALAPAISVPRPSARKAATTMSAHFPTRWVCCSAAPP